MSKYVDEILRICEEFDAGEFCGETWRDKVQQQIRQAQRDVLERVWDIKSKGSIDGFSELCSNIQKEINQLKKEQDD